MPKIILPFFSLLFLISSCASDSGSGKQDSAQTGDSTAISKDSANGNNAARTNVAGTFTITSQDGPSDPNTGAATSDIFVQHSSWSAPRKIVRDYSYAAIDPKDYTDKKIPAGADFAFSTWFAGGGYDYYGVQRDGFLKVYRRAEDEGVTPHSLPFGVFIQTGMDAASVAPDHFICYKNDDGKSAMLSIAFDSKDKAMDARLKTDSDWTHLEFLSSSGNTSVYKAMQGSTQTGTFTLTHSGIHDYAEFKPASGASKKYSIDLDSTTNGGDTYRTSPCF